MWCWAPNPEDSGLKGSQGEVCEICSDNEKCMVGILWGKIADLKEELDNPPMYFAAIDFETREEIDVYPLREVRDFMDRLKMALLVSAKKEGEEVKQ
jgi:hypothetical protein